MDSTHGINTVDVVILCGGQGKRLRTVLSDRPKPMAEIAGRPFLDILIEYVSHFGSKRFILCTGYKGSFIRRYYEGNDSALEIIISEERTALGTAGAIKNAQSFIRSSPFFVLNGDSFCRVDLRKFLSFHKEQNALCSLAVSRSFEANDYGLVTLDESQRIIAFHEKAMCHKDNFVNAGVCLLQKEALSLIPANEKFSLEMDFFPKIIEKQFYGFSTKKSFIDIGTPERYEKAKKILSKLNEKD